MKCIKPSKTITILLLLFGICLYLNSQIVVLQTSILTQFIILYRRYKNITDFKFIKKKRIIFEETNKMLLFFYIYLKKF